MCGRFTLRTPATELVSLFDPLGLSARARPAGPDGSEVETCTPIAGEPHNLVAPLHNQVPVILPPERYDLWLDPAIEGGKRLLSLLVPYPAEELAAHPVESRVTSPKPDGPGLIEPAG
ncbi:MAG TPA: SOS response-associated peptidase family protein [Planctomycetaceae bacterium]